MSHEQKQEEQGLPQQETASSVSSIIAWEQPRERNAIASSSSNVIDIDTFRRQDVATIDTEATVTVREFQTVPNETPIRLVVISSGFGQKQPAHSNTIQCKAA